jgi:uncharacterized SAM-binding protein YcdF (DUF218 family)
MKRRILIALALVLFATVLAVAAGTLTQRRDEPAAAAEATSGEVWEYLVVAGASTNLSPTGNPTLRKEPGAFSREAFVIEQAMDKLGAKGWELVSVSGGPGDPTFYFKRKK